MTDKLAGPPFYYLSHELLGEKQVTKEEFIKAEQAAGFRSKGGPGTCATGGFGGMPGCLRGRVSNTLPEVFDRDRIKRIFLAKGFKEKEQGNGEVDLNPYVYEAAITLLNSYMPNPARYWINQPSSLQPLHSRHGENVLAVPYTPGSHAIYTLKGDVTGAVVPSNVLSAGWTLTVDLSQVAWEEIQQAAAESAWMPKEYMMNEWVSDVCSFLRDPRPATEAYSEKYLDALITTYGDNLSKSDMREEGFALKAMRTALAVADQTKYQS